MQKSAAIFFMSVHHCRRRIWQTSWRALLVCAGKFFDKIENYGNEKDADEASGKHSSDHSSPQNLTSDSTGASSSPQRNGSQDESERRHQNRTKTKASAFERSVHQRLAFLQFFLGKLNDQNGVFGRKANQHDQTDLGIDISFDLHHIARQKRKE